MSSGEDLKKQKRLWIMNNVAENGFDTSKFNAFVKDKYSKSNNKLDCGLVDKRFDVDSCTLDEVKQLVAEYKQGETSA